MSAAGSATVGGDGAIGHRQVPDTSRAASPQHSEQGNGAAIMKLSIAVGAVALVAGLSVAHAAGGAPGGQAFCTMYGKATAGLVNEVLKRKPSCLDPGRGVHADYAKHFEWCMNNPESTVAGAARHIRELAIQCVFAGTPGALPKFSGMWAWERPLTIMGGPPDKTPTPVSLELLQNNGIWFCMNSNAEETCKRLTYTQTDDVYYFALGTTDTFEVRLANGGLYGEFWWNKAKRHQTTPDGTFVLK